MNNETKNAMDLYTVVNEFKKGYQTRVTLVKDDNLLVNFHIFKRWTNHFCWLLNIHDTEIYVAASLAQEPSAFEVTGT